MLGVIGQMLGVSCHMLVVRAHAESFESDVGS